MHKHIINNNLLSPNQSGFRTGDSCIKQLHNQSLVSYLHLLTKEWKVEQYL